MKFLEFNHLCIFSVHEYVVMCCPQVNASIRRCAFLPYHVCDKISSPKDFVQDDFQVMSLVVVDINPNSAI